MIWRDAVLEALQRYAVRHRTRRIERRRLIDEELGIIVDETGSIGKTPDQTLSRVLQELRDEGLLRFLGGGSYVLAEKATPERVRRAVENRLE